MYTAQLQRAYDARGYAEAAKDEPEFDVFQELDDAAWLIRQAALMLKAAPGSTEAISEITSAMQALETARDILRGEAVA